MTDTCLCVCFVYLKKNIKKDPTIDNLFKGLHMSSGRGWKQMIFKAPSNLNHSVSDSISISGAGVLRNS